MRVICAMSGGVDSSVAALLLKQKGYEVIGVSMKLSETPADPNAKSTGCCSVKDFNDARSVCDSLGIPFYAMNFKEAFREKVMNTFVSEYLNGRTPNPCVLCNQDIKFDAFLKKARELGAESVATGHYARIRYEEGTKRFSLLKGVDSKKDQSYFLFSLGQKELPRILFPVGGMTKVEVRALAREHHLKTQDKAESQEICFVPEGEPGRFIEKFAPERVPSGGEFVDEDGRVLGRHEGVHHYTIGQRRGTQVSMGRRFYVKRIDAATGRITLGEDSELYQESLFASRLSWSSGPPAEGEKIQAKIRYRHDPAPCRIRHLESGGVEVRFEEPQRAISPGQAVVFYSGERVLGGGWIEKGL
jgi:tRNA-uridine 2-sulfurtransferase